MTDEEMKAEMIRILKEHGMKISIDGCGCCESPSVMFYAEGRYVVFEDREEWSQGAKTGRVLREEVGFFNVDMFREEREG